MRLICRTVGIVFALVLISNTMAVAKTAITLFYHNYNFLKAETEALCAYAKADGFNLVCRPLIRTTGVFPPVEQLNEVTKAAKSGPVILSASGPVNTGVRSIWTDLRPLIQKESAQQRTILNRLLVNNYIAFTKSEMPVVFYRQDALQAAGLDAPTAKLTWDGFITLLERLRPSGGYVPWSFSSMSNQRVNSIFAVADFNFNPTINDWHKITQAKWPFYILKRLVQLDALGLMVASPDELKSKFIQGNLPVMFSSMSVGLDMPGNVDWCVSPYPMGANGSRSYPLVNMQMWSLIDRSGRLNEGWAFLRWLLIGKGARWIQQQAPLSITGSVYGGNQPNLPNHLRGKGVEGVFASLADQRVFMADDFMQVLLNKENTTRLNSYFADLLTVEDVLIELRNAIITGNNLQVN